MRRVQPKWLIQAFGLAGLAYGLAQAGVPMAAQAQARVQRTEVSVDSKRTEPTERVEATDLPPSRTYIGNPAQACANQSEAVALERIAGCAKLIESGRLKGKPLGVAYSLRGLAFLDRGDVPHAIADLNRAVDLAPDFPPAYQNRGNAWFARGNYGQAIADYDATIKLDPEDPSPYVNRAAVRRDLGFTDGALEDYQKAISLGADRATPYSGRGQIYLRAKEYPRAIADFDRAVRLDPSHSNYMLRGEAREGNGDLDRALHDYQEASRVDPKSVGALTAQAMVLRKKGDLERSVAVYTRAVMVDQNLPMTYTLRAEALALMGDRKRAMKDVTLALKFAWIPRILKVRGALRLEDDDLDGAARDAETILKVEPDNVSAFALRGAA